MWRNKIQKWQSIPKFNRRTGLREGYLNFLYFHHGNITWKDVNDKNDIIYDMSIPREIDVEYCGRFNYIGFLC